MESEAGKRPEMPLMTTSGLTFMVGRQQHALRAQLTKRCDAVPMLIQWQGVCDSRTK